MNRTVARIATALLAFVLGIASSSLWHFYRTPQRKPPPVSPTAVALNEPVTTPIIPDRDYHDLVFRGNLKLVANEVQITNELLRYKIHAKYPQIDGWNGPPIQKLNKHIERLVTNDYQWVLYPTREDLHRYKTGYWPEAFNSVYLNYEVVLANDAYLSIYFEGESYGIGAAHAVQYSFVVNYNIAANRHLKLSDLFKPGSNYLKFISEFCITELSRGKNGASLWQDKLAPVAENFESWNITPEGIRFNFDECTVLSSADGKQTVLIPYTAFNQLHEEAVRKLVWNK